MIACVIGLGIALAVLLAAYLGLCGAYRELSETHAALAAYTARLLDRPRFYAQQRSENILMAHSDPEAN